MCIERRNQPRESKQVVAEAWLGLWGRDISDNESGYRFPYHPDRKRSLKGEPVRKRS